MPRTFTSQDVARRLFNERRWLGRFSNCALRALSVIDALNSAVQLDQIPQIEVMMKRAGEIFENIKQLFPEKIRQVRMLAVVLREFVRFRVEGQTYRISRRDFVTAHEFVMITLSQCVSEWNDHARVEMPAAAIAEYLAQIVRDFDGTATGNLKVLIRLEHNKATAAIESPFKRGAYGEGPSLADVPPHLVDQGHVANEESQPTFLIRDVYIELNCSPDTLHRIATRIRIPTAPKADKKFRWTLNQVVKILEAIGRGDHQVKLKTKASAMLRRLNV